MNSTLAVNGTQQFMGRIIPIVYGGFGENKKVISSKTISEIHNSRISDINASIKRLILTKRINESIDYIDLLSETVSLRNLAIELGLLSSNRTKNAFVLSERGYSRLIKAMDDDTSWDVHDKLVDEYFQLRETNKFSDYITRAEFTEFTNSLTSCLTAGFAKIFESQNSFYASINNSMSNLTKYLIVQNTPALTPEELYPKPEEAPRVSPQVKEYKNQIYELCNRIVANSDYESSNLVLSYAYRLINKRYGICWDQEIKDYMNENCLDRKPALINVIAESDDCKYYKSILLAILTDLADQYCKETSVQEFTSDCENAIELVTTWKDAQMTIPKLAELTNDTSVSAGKTYQKIYKIMENDNKINWSYYRSVYKKNNGICNRSLKPPKKSVIGNSPKLQKIFIAAVNNEIQNISKR